MKWGKYMFSCSYGRQYIHMDSSYECGKHNFIWRQHITQLWPAFQQISSKTVVEGSMSELINVVNYAQSQKMQKETMLVS